MMAVCVPCLSELLSEGAFACMAGLLHVMLTGFKLFWSSRKKKKKVEN